MATLPDPLETSAAGADQPSLVVVGSSAGGIEALSKLVSTLPAGFPAPIVLAQHLDPHQPSHLGEILARYSHVPVVTVTDHAPLEAGTIYVIPADRNVEVTNHELRLHADGPGRRPMPSINLLLSSAARTFAERLIAVILTGTGSDGASGAYQVKAAGGIVIIENPETAAYPALPASLAPTTVDFVADLERIGPLLSEILTKAVMPLPLVSIADEGEQGAGAAALDGVAPRELEALPNNRSLRRLLKQVQEHTNIDFSQYKLPTILRRLHRRMFATSSPDLVAYVQYLESHPDEYPHLVSSFLINVTEFFRDPEVFATLEDRVLPDLIAEARTRGNVLRLWSAGCATGEEAYSLAILIAEVLGEELNQFSVQIFATDVDESAIEFARHAIYPAAALTGLSPQRRARFFHKLDGNYQIIKSLRGLVIFGLHDLGLGAPFPRIDLVLCRNVLMYFTTALQARALQAFAFSLRNGGYLALGTAESVSPAAKYFTQVTPTLKLYRRKGERVLFPTPTTESLQALAAGMPARLYSKARASASAHARGAALTGKQQQPSLAELVLQEAHNTRERLGLVVLGLPVGIVVVDRHYDVQIINATAMRLLDIYTEPTGEDLIHLARTIPSDALQQAIDAAFRRELWPLRPVVSLQQAQQPTPTTAATPVEPFAALAGVVTVETLLGERRSLQLTCYPFIGSGSPQTETVDATEETPAWSEEQLPAPATPAQHDAGAGATSEETSASEVPTSQAPTGGGGDAAREAGARRAAEASASAEALPLSPSLSPSPSRVGNVPLVLVQIRDVTDVVRQFEQEARATAYRHEVSAAEQAHARSELEATFDRLQSEVTRLTAELTRQSDINRTLLEGNQKLGAANLELRNANEDLQISEEEAEAATEEVKTLNEELQASNEELLTLNEELEATVEELHASNDELQARTRELQEMTAKLAAKGQDGSE